MDESNDICVTTQFLIFIRSIVIIEELAALHSLKGTTKSEDLFEKVCYTFKEMKLDWAKLKSVISDEALNLVGSKMGLLLKLNKNF